MDNLKSIFDILQMNVKIKVARLYELSAEIRWIPILCDIESCRYMGISEDGYWVVEHTGAFRVLNTLTSYWCVFVLLEQPLHEIREQVNDSFVLLNINADVDNVFLFLDIVRAGLEVGTTYWAELAFTWCDELPHEKKRMLKDVLIKIVEQKLGSQKHRHKAMKELRQIWKNV